MGLRLSYSLADQEFIHTKSLGVWNVSTQLLSHLARHPDLERLTVFTNRTQTELTALGSKVTLEEHNAAVRGRWGRIRWDQWDVYSAARQSGNPWLFLPKGFASFYRRSPVRLAAYVHDAMHDHYRQAYEHNPLAREAGYFLRSLRATLQQAEVIFTNTDFTRSEVHRLSEKWQLPTPHVVTAGIGFEMFKPRVHGNGQRQRIVVLAGPWPHKCTGLAVQWMQRWAAARTVYTGVDWIGGMPADVMLPSLPGWKHHQRLSQQDYERVLGDAAVLVYFSAYEGFGMPPVEGTLAGAAAVYSAIPAMLEVMDGCGYAFKNDSFEQFADAMDRALRTTPEQLAEWQLKLGRRHSWINIADRIVNELQARQPQTAPRGTKLISPAPATPKAEQLLVFAHVPPPHHGQSYMVKLMLEGFGGDQCQQPAQPPTAHGIACLHVNARFSRQLEDIGNFDLQKVTRLLRYCFKAIRYRHLYGVKTLYYVPAPGKLSALLRDWLVLALCRPFYPQLILHWHAAGLGTWIEEHPTGPIRWVSRRLLRGADLSIVLSEYNRADAEKLQPKRVRIVGNGIPDPCPDFETALLPRRRARLAARQLLSVGKPLEASLAQAAGPEPDVFRILYLAHCIREKGLFDTLDGVALVARKFAQQQSTIRPQLIVAGEFMNSEEEAEFKARIQQPDLLAPDGKPMVQYVGFVSGERKREVFLHSDCFCFPTYYYAESFGLVVVEAMSYGLPVVTSRWRSVPELLPADYEGLVDPHSPGQIADALGLLMLTHTGEKARERFEEKYRLDRHLSQLAAAIHSLDQPPDAAG
jgi:glycosyltransferase involved in cell wall biosynthesis